MGVLNEVYKAIAKKENGYQNQKNSCFSALAFFLDHEARFWIIYSTMYVFFYQQIWTCSHERLCKYHQKYINLDSDSMAWFIYNLTEQFEEISQGSSTTSMTAHLLLFFIFSLIYLFQFYLFAILMLNNTICQLLWNTFSTWILTTCGNGSAIRSAGWRTWLGTTWVYSWSIIIYIKPIHKKEQLLTDKKP